MSATWIFLGLLVSVWLFGVSRYRRSEVRWYMIRNGVSRWVPEAEVRDALGFLPYAHLLSLEADGELEHREVPTPSNDSRCGGPRFEYKFVGRRERRREPAHGAA